MRARALLSEDFDRAFRDVDVIVERPWFVW